MIIVRFGRVVIAMRTRRWLVVGSLVIGAGVVIARVVIDRIVVGRVKASSVDQVQCSDSYCSSYCSSDSSSTCQAPDTGQILAGRLESRDGDLVRCRVTGFWIPVEICCASASILTLLFVQAEYGGSRPALAAGCETVGTLAFLKKKAHVKTHAQLALNNRRST